MTGPARLLIRSPVPSDAEAWAQMLHEIYGDDNEYVIESIEAARPLAEAYCGGKAGADVVLTAFLDGSPVGLLQARHDDERTDHLGWYITAIGVRPSCRRRGVGKALVAALTAEAHRSGCRVFAAARKSNAPAVRLFESCGFRVARGVGRFEECVALFVSERGD